MFLLDKVIAIRETQGTNAKLDKLRELGTDDKDFLKVLFYTYNPFYLYYAIKLPKVEYTHNPTATLEDMFDLLDELRSRKSTGNAALDRIAYTIHESIKENGELLKLILGRDLKMGCNVSSINKVFPKLIPTFDVMLADSGIDIAKVIKKYPFMYVQKKSDGKRCIGVCERMNDGTMSINFYARSGKEMENLVRHESLINAVKDLRENKINYDFILDGELIIEQADGTDANRQYSNGLINQKNLLKDVVEQFSFVVWDIVSLKSFEDDNNDVPYEDRYKMLTDNIQGYDKLHIIPTFTATTEEQIMEITANFIAQGFEGSIVKTPFHFYKRKRTKDWIKFKAWCEIDLKVISYNLGADGTKYESCLGALSCTNGTITCSVGTGFSDEQRLTIKEDIVGKIITVKYNQLIKDINGSYSLFLPVFVEIRDDKDIPDSMGKVIKESSKFKN